ELTPFLMTPFLMRCSKAPPRAIGRTQVSTGGLVIGEAHLLVVPMERLPREPQGNQAKQPHLCQWASVSKVRTGRAPASDGFDPIPGVAFDPGDLLRRRVGPGVLLDQVLRQQAAVGPTVGTVDNHS